MLRKGAAPPTPCAMSYVHLAIAIASEVVATSFLAKSEGFTRPVPTLVMAIGYLIAFYFLSLTLRHMPTGIVYAIWSGAGIVLIAAIAWAFQGQKLDGAAIAGIAMILGGVLVINLFSSTAGH